MAKMKPGVYEARISNYAIGTTQAGDPQVLILLNYNDEENAPHEVTWFGSLKEGKAQEITLRTLLDCGFSGSDPVDLADGTDSHLLDVITPVRITIEEHEYQGKKSLRVQWINRMGGRALEKKITKSEARIKLGALNLKGALAQARQEMGVKAQKSGPGVPSAAPGWDSDIGF